jgi:starch phosphorylase
MALERIRELRNANGMTFDEALEATKSGNVFTMHTPIKAGLDEFSVQVMDKYFGTYFPHLGINRNRFLALGRILPDDDDEPFKMPVLAIRLSSYINGVSQLHGQVSREMWSALWPGIPVNEVPIESITNGTHIKSWLSDELNSLYERYLGPNWTDETADKSIWETVNQIPDEEYWQTHRWPDEVRIIPN